MNVSSGISLTSNTSLTTANGSEGDCLTIPQTGEYRLREFVFETVYLLVIAGAMTAALAVMWKAKGSRRILLDKFIVLEFIVTYAFVAVYYGNVVLYWTSSPQNACQNDVIWRLVGWGLIAFSTMRATSITILTLVRFLSVVSPYFFERHLAFSNRSIYVSLLIFCSIGAITGGIFLSPSIVDLRFYNAFCFASLRAEKNRVSATVTLSVSTAIITATFVINLLMLIYTHHMEQRIATVTWDVTMTHAEAGHSHVEGNQLGDRPANNKIMLAANRSKSSGGILHHSTNNPHMLRLGLRIQPANPYQTPRGLSNSDSDIPSSLKSEFKRPMDDFQLLVPTPQRATHQPHASERKSLRVCFAGRCQSVDLGVAQKKTKAYQIHKLSVMTKTKFRLAQERFSASPITKLIVTTSIIHLTFNIPILVSISIGMNFRCVRVCACVLEGVRVLV